MRTAEGIEARLAALDEEIRLPAVGGLVAARGEKASRPNGRLG
jgi:hypothetical protein